MDASTDKQEVGASTEPERVFDWRYAEFMRLGADEDEAFLLADSTVDLHEFERLRRHGCSPTTAALILM